MKNLDLTHMGKRAEVVEISLPDNIKIKVSKALFMVLTTKMIRELKKEEELLSLDASKIFWAGIKEPKLSNYDEETLHDWYITVFQNLGTHFTEKNGDNAGK